MHGCIDTASRKVIWLRICTDNSDPRRTARWCFDYLFEKRIVPETLRIDTSFGIGNMTTIHLSSEVAMVTWEILPKKAIDTGKTLINC